MRRPITSLSSIIVMAGPAATTPAFAEKRKKTGKPAMDRHQGRLEAAKPQHYERTVMPSPTKILASIAVMFALVAAGPAFAEQQNKQQRKPPAGAAKVTKGDQKSGTPFSDDWEQKGSAVKGGARQPQK
jgi:hypothetical protein